MTRASRLILASQSPRRRQLLEEAGYDFEVIAPNDSAEAEGNSSGRPNLSPPSLVMHLAWRKAADVAPRIAQGIVIGCDTVAEVEGRILGKPIDRDHAREMLEILRGRVHHVYSGLCCWQRPGDTTLVQFDETKLKMADLSDRALSEYLDSGAWQGKAGAFGYQDRMGWLEVVEGSESNVVGLPLELLARMLGDIASENAG